MKFAAPLLILLLLVHGAAAAPPEHHCTASRVNPECASQRLKEQKLGGKLEIEQVIDVPDFDTGSSDCDANVDIEYWREGDEIVVEAAVENKDCAASRGEYRLVLQTGKGIERNSRSFTEAWLRDNDESLLLEHRYPIDPDEELRRVRLVTKPSTRCFCD